MKVLAELLSHLLSDGLNWFSFSEKVIKLSLLFKTNGFNFTLSMLKSLVMALSSYLFPQHKSRMFKGWRVPLLYLNMLVSIAVSSG